MANETTKVEVNGANPVKESERYGTARGLFPIWFSWNVSILGITYGIYVYSLGLSPMQAIVAGILGYFISCGLVGILAVGGTRTGLPTLVQTRFAFGYVGNKIPTLFAYISNMGWQVIIISVASMTGADWIAHLLPGTFANELGQANTLSIGMFFVITISIVMFVSIYGYQLILKVENIIAWITGIMTLIFIMMILPEINLANLNNSTSGSFYEFLGGLIMAMTMVGLGFLNCGGDFARYLPVKTKANGIIGWTTLGIALPVSILLVLGVLLSATNPELSEKAAMEPVAALTSMLPMWFYIPFSIVIIISLLAASITGVYSSGLALLAMGMPTTRAVTTAINAVIIAAGSIYLTFISDSFLNTFQAFLATISVVVGAMAAIQLIDFIRQKRLNWNVDMALSKENGGVNYRWGAVISLFIASFIGLGTITSADPYIAYVVGFLLSEEAKQSVLASANIGVIISMVVGAVLYSVLTFAFKVENKQ